MSYGKIKKVISILTVFSFLISNILYAAPSSNSFFKNKKIDYQKLSDRNQQNLQKRNSVIKGDDPQQQESRDKEAQRILSSHLEDLSQINLPSELGRVVEVHEGQGPLIVHIQDLHANPEAQINLAGILEFLVTNYNLDLVCSEGADGMVDTSSVSSFPDYEARERVSRLFVDSGELTGEEYLSITKYPELPIWGIEDRDIYLKNIVEFNKIMKLNSASQVFISQAKKALEGLKSRVYSKELLDLDQKEADYKAQKIESSEYINYLLDSARIASSPDRSKNMSVILFERVSPAAKGGETDEPGTAKYKNVTLLKDTIETEKNIDQMKVMNESQNLLLSLQSSLAAKSLRSEIDSLMAKAQLFKDQKISPFSFYSYLKDLANKHLKDDFSAKYSNLDDFVGYLAKVNSIDSTKLFLELENLNFEIKEALSKTDEQRTLVKAIRNIDFLEGFFNLKVSNEELDYYLDNKDSCKVSFFEDFLKPAVKKYNIPAFVDYNPALIDAHLQELEDFYKTVKERDSAMVRNTLSEIDMRGAKVSALISGGFHTKGVTKLLKEKGYSYIVVSPYSKTETDEKNYHSLLSGKRKDITELLKEYGTDRIVKNFTSLRSILISDQDLCGIYNDKYAPEIAKILGVEADEARIQELSIRIGALLASADPGNVKRWGDKRPVCDLSISVTEDKAVIYSFRSKYQKKPVFIKLTKDKIEFTEKAAFANSAKIVDLNEKGAHEGVLGLVKYLRDIGLNPVLNNKKLAEFDTTLELHDWIKRYSVIKSLDDLEVILRDMVLLKEGKRIPVDKDKKIIEAIYNSIFEQEKFLEYYSKEKPFKIAIFRGGRGAAELTQVLGKLPNVQISIVVGATDDGRSWFTAAQEFNATGMPDCGKSLLDLANDKAVKTFLETRMKCGKNDESSLNKEFGILVEAIKGHTDGDDSLISQRMGYFKQLIIDNVDKIKKELVLFRSNNSSPVSKEAEESIEKALLAIRDIDNTLGQTKDVTSKEFINPIREMLREVGEEKLSGLNQKDILRYVSDIDNANLSYRLYQIAMLVSVPKLKQIYNYLEAFNTILGSLFKDITFSFNTIPMRSVALVGAAWYYADNKSDKENLDRTAKWQTAADAIGNLLDAGDNRVFFATEKRQHLMAMTSDGTIYFTETGINEHPKTGEFIGLWLFDKKLDMDAFAKELETEGIFLEHVEQEANIDAGLKKEVDETTRKVADGDAEKIRRVANIIAGKSRTAKTAVSKIEANNDAVAALKEADVIIYGTTTLESNMGSALIVEGIREAIKKSDAVKLNFVNPTVENDRPDTKGSDMIKRLYTYVSDQQLYESDNIDWSKSDKYVEYVVGIGEEYPGLGRNKIYIPFDRSLIDNKTNGATIPVALDLEKKSTTLKSAGNYSAVNEEYGFYDANIMKQTILSLAGVKKLAGYNLQKIALFEDIKNHPDRRIAREIEDIFNNAKEGVSLSSLIVAANQDNFLLAEYKNKDALYAHIKRVYNKIIEKSLMMQDKEAAIQVQLLAGQALNIAHWIIKGIPLADSAAVTLNENNMVQNDKRGKGYLDKNNLPDAVVEVKEEGKAGFYWRGWEGIKKLGDNVNPLFLDDAARFKNFKDKVVLYIMDHGFLKVPSGLKEITDKGILSTIHETTFINDKIPGSYQVTSTGKGHYQVDTLLDVKYVTEGKGIQFNVKYDRDGKIVDVIAQEIEKDSWALALPGYVDYVINLGGLRFNDISIKLSEKEAKRFNPDFDAADSNVIAKAFDKKVNLCPYTAIEIEDEFYLVKNSVYTPQPAWIDIKRPDMQEDLVDFYSHADMTEDMLVKRLIMPFADLFENNRGNINTFAKINTNIVRSQFAQIESLKDKPNEFEPAKKYYAWAGTALGTGVAEKWFNSTQVDGLSSLPFEKRIGKVTISVPITLKELTEYYPQETLGGHKTKPFFVKYLCTRFPPKVYMGFNKNIEKVGQKTFIEWLKTERKMATELKKVLENNGIVDTLGNRRFTDDFAPKYEEWAKNQAEHRWNLKGDTLVLELLKYTPSLDFAWWEAFRDNRAKIVSVLNEIELKPGMVVLSPVMFLHGIFGLGLQTHPPSEHPEAKNEAWIVISDGKGGVILVEPQQTSNTTFNLADFYTPIQPKEDKLIMRKYPATFNKGLDALMRKGEAPQTIAEDGENDVVGYAIPTIAERGLEYVSTTVKDFDRTDEVEDITDTYQGAKKNATVELVIEGPYRNRQNTINIWPKKLFITHRITLGVDELQPGSIIIAPENNTFYELLVTEGEITLNLNVQGEDISLKAGQSLFIPASVKDSYTLTSKGKATVLKFYKPVEMPVQGLNIKAAPDKGGMAKVAAGLIHDEILAAHSKDEIAVIRMPTGNTPLKDPETGAPGVYDLLAEYDDIDWSKVVILMLDEYGGASFDYHRFIYDNFLKQLEGRGKSLPTVYCLVDPVSEMESSGKVDAYRQSISEFEQKGIYSIPVDQYQEVFERIIKQARPNGPDKAHVGFYGLGQARETADGRFAGVHIAFNEEGSDRTQLTRRVELSARTIFSNADDLGIQGQIGKTREEIRAMGIEGIEAALKEDRIPKAYGNTVGMREILEETDINIIAVNGENKIASINAVVSGVVSPDNPASYLREHENTILIATEDAMRNLKRQKQGLTAEYLAAQKQEVLQSL